jgi:polyketide biosynthesis acyl carrier protein
MNVNQIFELIVKHTCEIIPELEGHNFQFDNRLADLGANSVDRAEIVTMTMESLSLSIPRTELFGATNMGTLAEVFYEKLQAVESNN